MAKTIELQFLNAQDKTVTIVLDDPIDPVDPAAVNTAMDQVLLHNAFTSSGGDLVEKKGARIVERNVSDIMLG